MRRQVSGVLVLLALGAVAAAACSSDKSTGTDGSTDLSGNYSLVAFKEDTNPPVGPPVGTGTLVLTTTNYHLTINVDIPLPGDTIALVDSGTYTTSGDSIAEHSTGGLPDALGTFSVKSDTLNINVTESALHIQTVWHKN